MNKSAEAWPGQSRRECLLAGSKAIRIGIFAELTKTAQDERAVAIGARYRCHRPDIEMSSRKTENVAGVVPRAEPSCAACGD